MWPQEQNWPQIKQTESENGRQRAKDKFQRHTSWSSRLRYVSNRKHHQLLSEWQWALWRTLLLKEKYTKARLEFAKMNTDNPQCFWEIKETKQKLFGESHQLGYILGLLCCIWYWISSICAVLNEISKLSRNSRANCTAYCQIALF